MKVVGKKLITLEKAVPVYDLSMNPENPCFALDAGVISHNTIPSGCELRAMYPARFDDSFIIHADYSQMELAILARLSGDENLIAAFKSGKDIHRFVASRVWGLPEDQISGEQRRYAKACFTADQLVVLADFHMKPISELVIGEEVLAYNEHSEDYDVGEIVAVEMTGIRDTVILTLSTGEQINCTEDHEFLMSSGEYVEARNIEIGGQFMTVNDFELTLVSREEGARNVEVYDIEVTPQHNFLLGAGVIAHNCSFGILYGKSIKSMAEEMMKGDVVATEKLYEDFFGAFPKIKTFIASCHAKLHKDGIIPTLYGDILRIDQSLPGGRSERISVNAPIQCLWGGTVIPLADGRNVAIEDLVSTTPYLYAYSEEHNQTHTAKASKVWKTGEVTELVKVVLDNGEELVTTPEHLYMNKDGSYTPAEKLLAGDSLMPFNFSVTDDGRKMLHHNDGSSEFGFHNSARLHLGERPEIFIDGEKQTIHCHHKDFTTTNDSPENLEYLTRGYHRHIHGVSGFETFKDTDEGEKWRSQQAASMSHKNAIRTNEYPEWHQNQKDAVSLCVAKRYEETGNVLGVSGEQYSEIQKRNYELHDYGSKMAEGKRTESGRRNASIAQTKKFETNEFRMSYAESQAKLCLEKGLSWNTPEEFNFSSSLLGLRTPKSSYFVSEFSSWQEVVQELKNRGLKSPVCSENTLKRINLLSGIQDLPHRHLSRLTQLMREETPVRTFGDYLARFGLKSLRDISLKARIEDFLSERSRLLNHRVVSVERITLEKPVSVYDIEVPGYANFAVSSGIFIHNSSASTMAGYLIWQLYLRCVKEGIEMIPLVFTHDSKDAEIRGSQLFDYIGLMLEEMQDRADKQFGVPARVDWELGVSQHNMIELSIKEHTADKVVAGFKGGIIGLEQVVERLKKTFSNVSYEITESKQEFEDPEEMFTTRRAYTSTWGEYYESVKGILTIDLRRN